MLQLKLRLRKIPVYSLSVCMHMQTQVLLQSFPHIHELSGMFPFTCLKLQDRSIGYVKSPPKNTKALMQC